MVQFAVRINNILTNSQQEEQKQIQQVFDSSRKQEGVKKTVQTEIITNRTQLQYSHHIDDNSSKQIYVAKIQERDDSSVECQQTAYDYSYINIRNLWHQI